LRRRFAAALSDMYGAEVPAYGQLVRTCDDINRELAGTDDVRRITEERHGAIRVGGPAEMRLVARLFGLLGMYPVGFYDLREAASKAVPVVSTAFRPIEPAELERSAFRMFTSMLVTGDRRFFDLDTQRAVDEHVANRRLFGTRLTALIDEAERNGGVDDGAADEFVGEAVGAFRLDRRPIDAAWYERLASVSPVAADIGAGPGTHINHLTPRVLDIDELYRRMRAQGVEMIDRIQGPPSWSGPDVLLRQTSFRALPEVRAMRLADGGVEHRPLRVRFGEVEARGIALTPLGRERVDALLLELDAAEHPSEEERRLAAQVAFDAVLPHSFAELVIQGLAYTEVVPVVDRRATPFGEQSVPALLEARLIDVRPITYEDFLPASAAGIFQSNLDTDGTRRDDEAVTDVGQALIEDAIGRRLLDPFALAADQQARSVRDACGAPTKR
jgi:uncharacterized glyoxalase superfamily metalloenzyme YdcJ